MGNYHKENPGFEDSDYTAQADYHENLKSADRDWLDQIARIDHPAVRKYIDIWKTTGCSKEEAVFHLVKDLCQPADEHLKILLRFKDNAAAQSQATSLEDPSRLFYNGQYAAAMELLAEISQIGKWNKETEFRNVGPTGNIVWSVPARYHLLHESQVKQKDDLIATLLETCKAMVETSKLARNEGFFFSFELTVQLAENALGLAETVRKESE